MKSFLSEALQKIARISLVAFAAAFLFLGVANPALAFGSSNSNANQGTAQMNDLQETSQRAVEQEPRNREQVQRQAQRGPNEVQGGADLHGMNVPNNSQHATTVRDQVEQALEKVTPGN